MLKINTDLSALRPDANTLSGPAPKPQAAATSAPEARAAADPQDSAEISEAHRQIAMANQAASRSPLRDVESARRVAASLRQAIVDRQADVFKAHEGLSPERISHLLQ